MTNEQAIRWLKDYRKTTDFAMPQYEEALDMAIKALEQDLKPGHCEDCKQFRKFPYHADTLGRCIHHGGFCPNGDWYCADYEPQERSDKE